MLLSEIFEGFDPGADLNNLFCDFEVEKFIVSNTTNKAEFHIRMKRIVPWKDVRELEKRLGTFLKRESDVQLSVVEHFDVPHMTVADIFESYRQSFFLELSTESAINNSIIYNCFETDIIDSNINIKLRDSFLDRLFGARLTTYFTESFNVRFDKKVSVNIEYSLAAPQNETVEFCDGPRERVSGTEQQADKSGSAQASDSNISDKTSEDKKAAVAKAAKAAKDASKYKARPKLPPDPNLIYGKNFDGNIISISSIVDDIGEVVVSGQALSSESRELKNTGKILFTFVLTDFTDSINIKLFMTPEVFEEFKEVYKDKGFYTVKGVVKFDTYDKELNISSVLGIKLSKDMRKKRMDDAKVKRVELHAHTKMSDMDAVTEPEDLVRTAFAWGHKAVAITDHGVVQGFTGANHALNKKDFKDDPEKLKQFEEFKIIYGCEGYVVDDTKEIALNAEGVPVEGPACAISLLTDGTDAIKNSITSFAVIDCAELAGISSEDHSLGDLFDFIGNRTVLSLNPDQDLAFLKETALRLGKTFDHPVIDMDGVSRLLYPELQSYRIGALAKEFHIKGETKGCYHEARCLAELFLNFKEELKKRDITEFTQLNSIGVTSEKALKTLPSHHIILLCKNETGRINLYRLVSLSHLNYFHKRPRIPKSLIMKYREGLIIGSACEAGELFRAIVFNRPEQEIKRLCDFYDYYEVQPIGNNHFMIDDDDYNVHSEEDLRDLNRKIVALGEKFGKPVVATSDEHFLNPEDSIYRSYIMAAQGFKDADRQPPLFLHTTNEMLEEFAYLGTEKAFEIVVTNTNLIADSIEKISPVRPDKCPPVIKDSDKTLTEICYNKAHSMYGEQLPPVVEQRLEHELNSIIKNGFAVMYIIAQKLVWKSNEDGYLVGSRGSVGSSFVATMAGITEVNPLPPHYYCESCHYSEFDSDTCKEYAAKSGFDMPDKICPVCGKKLIKEGNNIPFETFLGFNGDKEPDIDLNFSGEYQSKAHAYTEVIFGEGQTFRAGTVSGLADKTAYADVYKYYEERGIHKRRCEIERLAKHCEGVKKTTGQHPGGIIVLPYGEEIYSFTPVQRPANDTTTTTVTTHFDYHSIDHNLLKLDILGHDDPTMIRFLQDLTGVSMKEIPMDDPKVVSLFRSPEALGITPEQIDGCPTGTLGLPELGTDFVIQMLVDTKPSSFSDMIRVSGLSHGTDVWLGNTQTLIQEGKCTLANAVCTRDDIMIYLISKNIDPGVSFKIMESVRKGKGLSPEWEQLMKDHDVPDWYIWSCKKIKYMFPKAHACAYIMMAFRIAWFKVYRPLAYYAAYFSIRATAMDYETMCCGEAKMLKVMNELKRRDQSSNPQEKLSQKEEDSLKDMKIVLEMYRRGLEFTPIDIFKAKATRFQIVDNKLMPCLNCIDGLGDNAAMQIEEGVKKGRFLSVDDFKSRCKLSQTVCDKMFDLGLLGDIPKSNQISIMDLFGV